MTGKVIGMGMINTDTNSVTDIERSMVETISSDTIFISAPGLNKNGQDLNFVMKSNSRASSHTSTTEDLEDVGEADSENEEVNIENENRAIVAAVESIRENSEDLNDTPQGDSERRNTAPACVPTKIFQFSTITVREYPRELGDNVTVMGPPIGLSWEHQEEIVYDLIEYDDACQDTRRTQSELKMPSAHRTNILRENGYSRQDIQSAIKRSNVVRGQRKRTVETLSLQPLQEALERVVRVGSKPLRKKESSNNLKMDKRKTI